MLEAGEKKYLTGCHAHRKHMVRPNAEANKADSGDGAHHRGACQKWACAKRLE